MRKFFLMTALVCAAAFARGDVHLPFDSVLCDDTGKPLGAQKVTVEFRLFAEATGGAALWGRRAVVTLSDAGAFNVDLCDEMGSPTLDVAAPPVTPLAEALSQARARGGAYLGLSVIETLAVSEQEVAREIMPRLALLLTPFAGTAADVDTASGDVAFAGALNATGVAANDLTIDGATTVNGSLSVTGEANVGKELKVGSTLRTGALTVGTLTFENASGVGELPVGSIIMWQSNTPPTGWALCDGAVHDGVRTPDLRDRFVIGSSTQHPLGTTGGSNSQTLTGANLPHHSHDLTFHQRDFAGSYNDKSEFITLRSDRRAHNYTRELEVSGTTGQSFDIRPAWTALTYIMRVK